MSAAALAIAAGLFFDDFSQPDTAALRAQGWVLRTAAGHPGVPGARWAPEAITLVDDPAQPGNRVLRLRAQTDGTPEGTVQAQACHQRKALRGTMAARVRFSAAPVAGADGDPVVQTFYLASPLAHDYDPAFSEVDFEHLPNGGWGSPQPRLYAVSWQTVRLDPWDARNQAAEVMGALDGWHTLVIQVDAVSTRHYLDGKLIATHGGRNVPVAPMAPSLNLWFSPGGLGPASAQTRVYEQDVDWVLHAPERQLSPAQVLAEVSRLRIAGVAQLDTVPPGPLPSRCDF
jgi:hypothetical protein